MIENYHLEITKSVFSHEEMQLLQFVPDERKEKIQRYRFFPDRLLSLYAALLTRMAVSKRMGVPADRLEIAYEAKGKPYLVNTENLHFNLSHTRSCILLCISDHQPVGADIEKLNPPPFEIMETAFHPDEISYIESASPKTKVQKFYEIWTKKEAYLKKIGTGFMHDPSLINTRMLPVDYCTYQAGDYLCTICSDTISNVIRHNITETDILNFFQP
ncbi:4'-phosphopantetheinyl transferase family protein [Lacrimispora brassicae]